MPEVMINYLAVLMSAVAGMVLGYVWYSPALFGKQFTQLMGKNEADLKAGMKPTTYPLMMFSSLVMAYVLAHFVDYAGAITAGEGMQAGFWAWLGFVATTGAAAVLFEGKPKGLYYLQSGYYLVQLMLMGAILAVWS